ncbi:MAG: DUF4350 domain-containing protein [Cryobacterium sp.]
MTVTAERPPGTPANATSSTPTLRATGRRWLFWIVAAAAALLVSIAAALIAGGSSAGGATLAADNPGEVGGRAVVEVLRDRGVTVTVADTLAEARTAVAGATDPTLLFFDPEDYLGVTQLTAMAGLAPRTVVVEPHFRALQALAPEVGFGGVSPAPSLAARCDLPAAVKAGAMSPGGPTLTLLALDAPGAAELTGCFPSDEDTFSVVQRVENGQTLTLVADTAVTSNGSIGSFGNAALALNLLGQSDTLVWYLPTLADVAATGPPSLGDLTPGWVTPTLVLLVLVALAAFIWRGRRFGPLVAENLPVTVRASETMEGRARLYARGDARLHALDALRIGTIARLATRLGLPGTAGVDEVVLAVAAITTRASADVSSVLVGAVPTNDRDLVALSDQLQDLERAAISASTPQPHGRMDP